MVSHVTRGIIHAMRYYIAHNPLLFKTARGRYIAVSLALVFPSERINYNSFSERHVAYLLLALILLNPA